MENLKLNSIGDILTDKGVKGFELEFKGSGYILSKIIDRFGDPGIEIIIDRFQNSGLYPQWWEEVLELDFIKEIEEKTDYLYHSHFYRLIDGIHLERFMSDPNLLPDPNLLHDLELLRQGGDQFLVICLSHKNWNTEGEYIYLDEIMKSDNVIEIGNNLDDIFNLGWPDADYDFSKNWGRGDPNGFKLFWNGQYPEDYFKRFSRPQIRSKKDQVWKLRFKKNNDQSSSELIKNLMIPFLKRLRSEYNIEVIYCSGNLYGDYNLEFSEDFESFEVKTKRKDYQNFLGTLDYIITDSEYFINVINDKYFDLILKIR